MLKLKKHWRGSALLVILMAVICLLSFAPLAGASENKATADYLPWSGWWWQKSHGELVLGYNGRPSPAEKYDLFVSGKRLGVAFSQGSQKWYDPQALGWEGMCNGWVNASILESGPILSSSANGVFLSAGDKKGLLTACHFKDEILYEYCSLSPEPFHRYLINYIGEKGEIIGADLDSTEAFWSYPIYAYDMSIATGEVSDYVTCTIKYASDFVDPDYKGTLELSATYRYRLDKDADGNYNGQGEWLAGDPGDLHPQTVWVPVGIKQDELFIDYKEVSAMVQTVDDELEGQTSLVPGHHLLVIYPEDEDTFTITPRIGEKITCYLALDHQHVKGDGASYQVERNSEIIESGELDSTLHKINISTEVGSDSFRLQILPSNNNQRGVCVHLYVDVQARYQSWFCGFPSEQYWLGCAATSLSGDDGARIWLEIDGSQGLPQGLGWTSGSSLERDGRWIGVLGNNLTDDYFSGEGTPIGFRLVSSTPYQGLLLAGDSHTLRGPSQSYDVLGSKLVIPWLTSAYNMTKFATLYFANQNVITVNATLSYFKNNGTLQKAVAIDLAPETTSAYSRGNYPGIGGFEGWGVIESSGDEFSGGVTLKEGYNRFDQLPLLKPGNHWVAPHLVTGSGWQTVLGVCNLNPETVTLELTAFIDGVPVGSKFLFVVEPNAKDEIVVEGTLFGLSLEQMDRAWLKIDGDRDSAAYLRYRYQNTASASIPLISSSESRNLHKLSHLAVTGGWWTGIVLLNDSSTALSLEITALNDRGEELQRKPLTLGAYTKFSSSVTSVFDQVKLDELAQLRVAGEGASVVKALAFYGGVNGVTFLSVHSW